MCEWVWSGYRLSFVQIKAMRTVSVKSRGALPAVNILLVEDNLGDARLAQEAFKMAHVANRLHVVASAEATLDFLYQRAQYAEAPRP